MLKLSAAVTGRRARSAECCWHVASTLLGEYIQGVCVEGRVCVSGEGGDVGVWCSSSSINGYDV